MKTLKTIRKSIFVAASLLLLASCNKDDAPASNPPSLTSSFVKGKIAGVSYASIVVSSSRSGTGVDAAITILGSDSSGNSITLALIGIAAPGTYTINNSTDSVLNYSPVTGGMAYATGYCDNATGTVTISAYDQTHVTGTFSFVGKDAENCSASKTITEGSFNAIFQN